MSWRLSLVAAVACLGAGQAGPEPHYRHPIVFCRGYFPEKVASKIWVMDDDGSNARQLTRGPSYDDHPSFYSDLRHVLYSEFKLDHFDPSGGARLIKLDIYSGAREVVAE